MAALKKAGIAERDIQTSNLNLNAQYAYEQNQPPKLTGYQASNQVTITVRDPDEAGRGGGRNGRGRGANTVNGISFGLADLARRRGRRPTGGREGPAGQGRPVWPRHRLQGRATGQSQRRRRLCPRPAAGPDDGLRRQARDGRLSTSIAGGELKVRIDVSAVYEAAK
ncbi:SIMPL domain-containing protein [Caulobacter segnis]